MKKEIEALIQSQSTTMTGYQIDNFVINDKMTPYKMLKQILLELGTRYAGLEDLELDTEEESLILEQLTNDLSNFEVNSIPYKLHNVKIKKQKKKMKELNKTLSNYMYEINILEANFEKIKKLGNPIDIINDKNGEEIYWTNKFIKEAQIDIMTNGRIGKGILDAILMLDENTQMNIINSAIAQAMHSNLYLSATENKVIKNIKNSQLQPSLKLNEIVEKKNV